MKQAIRGNSEKSKAKVQDTTSDVQQQPIEGE